MEQLCIDTKHPDVELSINHLFLGRMITDIDVTHNTLTITIIFRLSRGTGWSGGGEGGRGGWAVHFRGSCQFLWLRRGRGHLLEPSVGYFRPAISPSAASFECEQRDCEKNARADAKNETTPAADAVGVTVGSPSPEEASIWPAETGTNQTPACFSLIFHVAWYSPSHPHWINRVG